MKNNKGFAISLMLYAMILLIVTIFYIVLAIVKNRFTYSEKMVNNVIIEKTCTSALSRSDIRKKQARINKEKLLTRCFFK